WTFDIGGFAGELPSAELYLRAFALACFSPVVQWHSEPLGGQFSEIIKSNDSLNDRSPWNIAKRRNAPEAIEICAKLIKEREKLLPYIQEQAELSSRTGRPMMAALVFDFFEDETAVAIDDEYMFGEKLLVAPVILEGAASRKVWLPQGVWRDYWNGSTFTGPGFVTIECGLGEIPVWERMA
ncbi:MAG: glycoside hydrolase, partial [Clostridiales bacterium]|nr:glycoside hydrolase [Clostridiales bacterium]